MWVVPEAKCLAGGWVEVDTAASYVCRKAQTCRGIWHYLRLVLRIYEKTSICGAWCQPIAVRRKQNDNSNPNSEEEVPQNVRADLLWQAAQPVFSRHHPGEPLLQANLPHEFAHQVQPRRGPTKLAAYADNRRTTKDLEQSHHQLRQAPLRQLLLLV